MATAAPPEVSSLFMEMPEKPSLASMALMMETQEWHWQIKVTRGALAKLASKEPHLDLRVVIIAANWLKRCSIFDVMTDALDCSSSVSSSKINLRLSPDRVYRVPRSSQRLSWRSKIWVQGKDLDITTAWPSFLSSQFVDFWVTAFLILPAVSCQRVTS